jgi:hypothetical protein
MGWITSRAVPMAAQWRVFLSRRQQNPAYLKAGDVITASIATEDRVLDLGTQQLAVRTAHDGRVDR